MSFVGRKEWRRLSDEEAAQLGPASLSHHLRGGLFLRAIFKVILPS
jgi:hypothetical protein